MRHVDGLFVCWVRVLIGVLWVQQYSRVQYSGCDVTVLVPPPSRPRCWRNSRARWSGATRSRPWAARWSHIPTPRTFESGTTSVWFNLDIIPPQASFLRHQDPLGPGPLPNYKKRGSLFTGSCFHLGRGRGPTGSRAGACVRRACGCGLLSRSCGSQWQPGRQWPGSELNLHSVTYLLFLV